MAIVEEVTAEIKAAMRGKQKERLAALRMVRAAFIEALKTERDSDALSDEEAVGIIKRLAKQRRDSIVAYEAGGRQDLVDAEAAELAILEEFLPSLADEATTRQWVAEAVSQAGASGMGDMGKVMGALMAAHKAELDGKLASRLVREALAG